MKEAAMTDVEILLAIEDIKKLKARYFRYVDTKQWDELLEIFAPDVEFDAGDNGGSRLGTGDPVMRGAAQLTDFIRKVVSSPVAIHHGHTPEIDILTPTTAKGIWALEDRFFWPTGSARRSLHGYGYYFETYEKIDRRWRIKTMKNMRLKVEVD
jgi:SnoaL-like domain